MTSEEFIFRGNLADSPLPEIMATVHRYGVPGVMELSRNEENKRIYFIDGDVIFATSSNRGESLGDFLLAQGRISEAQYKVSSEELIANPGKRHGRILVQMGFLKADDLGTAVREQVQTILWSIFNWIDGDIHFKVGRFREEEVYKITIPTPRAVFSGCKRITDAKAVMARLGGKNTIFKALQRPKHLGNLRLEAGESRLLEMVDGKKTLFELCEEGPLAAGINARVLYALLELQLIEREEQGSTAIRIQVRDSGPA